MAPPQQAPPPSESRRPRGSVSMLGAVALGLVILIAAGVMLLFTAHRFAARGAARAHHLETAQHHLDAALKLQPQNRALRFEAARIARRRGDFTGAASHLAAVEKRTPGAPDVQLEHRLLLAQRGELQDVEMGLKGLVSQGHPDAALIQEALATGYLASGRLHDAQALLEELLHKDASHTPALLMLSQVFASLGRDEESMPLLRRAVQADPASSAAHLALAKALMLQGFEREAAGHFEWVQSLRPHDPEVLLGLAEYRSNAGERDEAQRLIDDLLQHHKDHPGGLTERARLALRRNQPVQAEELCRRALTAAPTDAMAWQVMANALHAQGRAADAARALDNHAVFDGAAQQLRYLAGELEERPNDPDVLAKVGAAYLRLNQPNQAEDYLQRALSVDPENATARQLLQQMRRRGRMAR